MNGPVLIILALALPSAAGLWLLLAGRGLRHVDANAVALVSSVLTLAAVIAVVAQRPAISRAWVPSLGIRWRFAVDGISAPLLLLTAAVGLAVVLHSRTRQPEGGSSSTFHGCLLLVVAGALGVFLTRDAVVFFIAFEVVLVPMWVLITRFGDQHRPLARADAGGRFILYTAFGSTMMLLGILLLVHSGGTSNLDALATGAGAGISTHQQTVIAGLLMLGLAVKVPVFPVHTWLPPAHTIAPTAGSVLLAAILLKLGTYGIVRLTMATVPEGFHAMAPALGVAGAIGIIWGGLVCLVERDLKRLIAYSSVAHMGFVAVGLASGTQTGLQAALFANVAHGLISALLFFIVGGLKERWGSADLAVSHDALREVAPRMGFALILGLAASLGLPGLAGFWGEFLSVYAAWSPSSGSSTVVFRLVAVAAAAGAVLSAAYALRVARLVWVGDEVAAPPAPEAHVALSAAGSGSTGDAGPVGSDATGGAPAPGTEPAAGAEPAAAHTATLAPPHPSIDTAFDTTGLERLVITVFSAAIVVLGVLPGPLLAMTSSATRALIGDGL